MRDVRMAHLLATLQCFKALKRDTCGAGDELEQSAPPLLVEGLHRLPEPLHYVTVGHTVLKPRVGLPVVQIDLPKSSNDQLHIQSGTVRLTSLNTYFTKKRRHHHYQRPRQ